MPHDLPRVSMVSRDVGRTDERPEQLPWEEVATRSWNR